MKNSAVAERADPPVRSLDIEFGGASGVAEFREASACLRLPLLRLGGDPTERIFPAVRPQGEAEGFQLYASGELLIGCGFHPVNGNAEAAALELYRRLLRAAAGRPLYRVWNYVPEINRAARGLENYRSFSAGRSQAFEEAFGPAYRQALPAASAVGCDGRSLAAVFVAGERAPRHFENPEQVPAYDYPSEHGPRSPSFSRSTVAEHEGRPLIFISGTAAIKGHQTIAPDDFGAQLDCTIDNLRLISRQAGAGDRLGEPGEFTRHFKVYLRHAADFPRARARLNRSFFRPGDRVVWLQAGLCRAELRIEIEATLWGS
jgi:chorismate lyase/3-hydroxybenzoate synthase